MEKVKVIIWGLGAMGGGMADMLLKKEGVEIVGAVGRGAKIGKSMFDYIKTEKGDRKDVIIGSYEDVIKPGAADIVLLCTDSFTRNAYDKLVYIMEQGIGISVEEFKERKANHTMSGHVGFAESVGMMAEGMGLEVAEFAQDMNPITTDVDRKSPYGFAAAGSCAGVAMTAEAKLSNGIPVHMDHPQQIEPEQVGVQTGDYVIIKGTPNVNLCNSPEIEGGLGTIAMCVNMIPMVINAEAGLKTMIDLPIPRAIMGDFRNLIKEEKKIVK